MRWVAPTGKDNANLPLHVVQPLGRAALDAGWQNRRRAILARTGGNPTRDNALRMYTLGSAWFAFAENGLVMQNADVKVSAMRVRHLPVTQT
jgi:hypothetical protein